MSDQNPPPQQPGPQQGPGGNQPYQHGYQPGMNPRAAAKAAKAYAKAERPWYKKKRFIIPAIIVVIIIIVVASNSGGSSDKGTQDTATTGSQKSGNGGSKSHGNNADNSYKGKGPISWGNWQVEGKLQISKEQFTNDFAVVARVKNTGDSVDRGLFTVTILKGQKILGTADCFTSDVNPGSVALAQCSSTDSYKPGWTEVTIENTI